MIEMSSLKNQLLLKNYIYIFIVFHAFRGHTMMLQDRTVATYNDVNEKRRKKFFACMLSVPYQNHLSFFYRLSRLPYLREENMLIIHCMSTKEIGKAIDKI